MTSRSNAWPQDCCALFVCVILYYGCMQKETSFMKIDSNSEILSWSLSKSLYRNIYIESRKSSVHFNNLKNKDFPFLKDAHIKLRGREKCQWEVHFSLHLSVRLQILLMINWVHFWSLWCLWCNWCIFALLIIPNLT